MTSHRPAAPGPGGALALTMGEPAGIGGEVSLKAWLRRDELRGVFFLIDDPNRLESLARSLQIDVPIAPISEPDDAIATFPSALPVLPLELPASVVPGTLAKENAPAVWGAIDLAVDLAMAGRAGAVVTNPINKLALYESGFKQPGHTEYLAELSGTKTEPVMMLASERLRVVAVTRHVSVARAVAMLTGALIEETADITWAALRRDFGIAAPRLAVAALNPHAGEGGEMGTEEIDFIGPTVERLRAKGMTVAGPLSADTLFHERARETYDAVLCMYHDQALIPIKTIDFDLAVNVTLGLPFIRTSPDHGTALDISGRGIARETSLMAALNMAADMAARRQAALAPS
jgi:4-hydroxythreonine-4-phosphate dehydrogenase